jgi:hypothetical protein
VREIRFLTGRHMSHVVGQALRPELQGDRPPRVCVDASGVGAGVMELLRTALRPHPRIEIWGCVITSGRAVTSPRYGTIHIAKSELAGSLRATLEQSRLRVPATLEYAETLRRELGDFQVKVTQDATKIFEAAPGQFDDLVICVTIPIFISIWLETKQIPILGDPGPRVLPAHRPASYAVTMGGLIEFRGQLFGRDRSDWRRGSRASPYRR